MDHYSTDNTNEHSFMVGDTLGTEKNHFNGYGVGDLERKFGHNVKRLLKYPLFKVLDKTKQVPFLAFQ